MSMMEPDEAEWMPAGDETPEAMWAPPGSNIPPFWGAPARPPLGIRPPVGQVPGRPVWPFWGYWGYRLRNAQRDIKYLAEVVDDIILDRIDKGILAPGPNAVQTPGVTPPLPTRPTPLLGVTDGSDAAPGIVGEFLMNNATIPYGAYPALTQVTVSTLVVPPGDWLMFASMSLSSASRNAFYFLSPLPTGASNAMSAGMWTSNASGDAVFLVSSPARGSFSVPTLLPFSVTINQADPGLPAGNASLGVECVRIR